MTPRKILILGAGGYQMPLIECAKKRGLLTIAVTPEGNYPGIAAADKVYFHDARDGDYITDVAEKEKVSGIISDQAEIFVRTIAYACSRLGLPSNPYSTACLYTDKSEMRKRGKELGLPTIESYVTADYDEAARLFTDLGGHAIIKPVDSFSSKGVSELKSTEDLQRCFGEASEISGTGEVIIEKMIKGPQFEVDSFAAGGHVAPLMYADLDEFSIPDVFSSRTRLYPSVADPEVIEKLLDYNQKINEGFGMYQGLSHNEYIMDEETGEIYLIEAALRGGGTYIASYITELQTGINTADFLVDVALGDRDTLPEYSMNRCHCGYAAFYLPAGEIISAEGLEEVEALDYVVKTTFVRIKPGRRMDDITDKNQRQAVVLYADSRDEMLQRIERIREMISVKVMTRDGVRGPVWE